MCRKANSLAAGHRELPNPRAPILRLPRIPKYLPYERREITEKTYSTMDSLVNVVSTVGNRITSNLKATFADLSPEKWIRLVIIIGAYMLLRPYILKLGAKSQMRSHEESEEQPLAEISPNQLRGKVDIPEDSDGEEEGDGGGAASTATDWGKKARRRQREVIRKMLDAEEERLNEQQGDDEDKDIEEFLVKE